jgi:hypothetical protein
MSRKLGFLLECSAMLLTVVTEVAVEDISLALFRADLDTDELVFFKVKLGDLSPTSLQQLKRDIIAEKKIRRGAKAQGSGKQPTGQSSEREPGSAGG